MWLDPTEAGAREPPPFRGPLLGRNLEEKDTELSATAVARNS
jgi:hypothetical protein